MTEKRMATAPISRPYGTNLLQRLLNKHERHKKRKAEQCIQARKIFWHVCTPKSASTFFMNYCAQQLGTIRGSRYGYLVSAVPEHGERQQVVCAYTLAARIRYMAPRSEIIMKHQHCLASQDSLRLIADQHVVIVQTRSILDTLVSMRDDLNRPSKHDGPWLALTRQYWGNLSDEQKLDLLIIHYLPWHIRFLQGWLHVAQERENVVMVDFEDVTKNTAACFERIFSESPTAQNITLTRENSRFNVGVTGRGLSSLSEAQIERARSVVRASDVLSQGLERFL